MVRQNINIVPIEPNIFRPWEKQQNVHPSPISLPFALNSAVLSMPEIKLGFSCAGHKYVRIQPSHGETRRNFGIFVRS